MNMRKPSPSLLATCFLVTLILTGFLQFRRVLDFDTLTTMVLARHALESGTLSPAEPLRIDLQGQPLPLQGWLSGVAFSELHSLGGFPLLRFGFALLFCSSFFIAAMVGASRHGGQNPPPRPFVFVAAIVLAFLVSLSHGSIRPQGAGVLCFALAMLLLVTPMGLLVRLTAVTLLALIWQNAHASVLLAVPLVGIASVRQLRKEPSAPMSLPTLAICAAIFFFAQFMTPFGLSIISLNRANFDISRELLRISEWLPAYDPSVRLQMGVYWLSLGVSFALLCRLRFRVRVSDLLTFLIFALFALLSARMGLFYSVAMVPVWMRWMDAALPRDAFRFTLFSSPRSRLAVFVVAIVVCVFPALVEPAPPFAPEAPIGIVEKLRTLEPLRVYNYREWAGLVAFFGGPNAKLSMDGRLYLSPRGKWNEYHDAALGRLDPTQLALSNETNAFFLHRGYHAGLVQRLEQSSEWRLLFAEGDAVVYVRRS